MMQKILQKRNGKGGRIKWLPQVNQDPSSQAASIAEDSKLGT